MMLAAITMSPGNTRAADDAASFLDQPKLTGNWWGARDTSEARGLALDVNLTQFYQGVTGGGKDRGFEYGGKLDTYVNFDGGKAGLWPGFSVTTHIETRYGEDVNGIDGLFSLANFNMGDRKSVV